MSNIHQLGQHPKKQQALTEEMRIEQASDWIAKIDRGFSEQEQELLKLWLAEAPENTEALLEVADLWDKMDELSRLSDLFPEHTEKAQSNTPWYGAIAASLLLVVSIAIYQGALPFVYQDDAALVAQQLNYETAVGESNSINLPDESKLVLNTDSFVQVKYTKNARIIELHRGEIHIDVAHDTTRPLSVVAKGKVIQAVGTAFNVEVRNQLVELIVTDGKVLVEERYKLANEKDGSQIDIEKIAQRLPNTSLAISKGEKVDLDQSRAVTKNVVKVDTAELAASLSWQQGNIIFRGEPLSEVMAEISRYTDIEFELAANQELEQVQVAGLFKTGDVKGLLEVLSNNFNINAEKIGQHKIVLSYAG